MIKNIARPTAMALALMEAAKKVDHKRPAAEVWPARRVLYNAEHTTLGVKVERSTIVR